MKNVFLTLSLVLALVSCGNSNTLTGTYTGKIPSADGSGICTKLELAKDNKFTIKEKHIGKEDSYTTEMGTWSVANNIITLSATRNKYAVKDGSLVMLDMSGKEITGSMANLYILKKCCSTTGSCSKDGSCSASASKGSSCSKDGSCSKDSASCGAGKVGSCSDNASCGAGKTDSCSDKASCSKDKASCSGAAASSCCAKKDSTCTSTATDTK